MKYINKYETESAALATSGLLAPQLVYVRESTDVLYSGSIPKFDEVVIEREGNELVINPKPTVSYAGLKMTSTGNSTVALAQQGTAPTVDLKYSLDNGVNWTQWDFSVISLTDGQTVCFKGQNTTFATSSNNYNQFVMTGNIEASGNVMSLLDNGSCTMTTIPGSYCLMNLFRDCTALTTPPELPATTLAPYCYYYMFRGCSNLISAPELPAGILSDYCYNGMFRDCISLTTAPELPALTLQNYCYAYMFYGCSSLTTSPELPALTLTNYCYSNMFYNCSSLNYVKCLATDLTKVNSGALYNWLSGVSQTGTFVQAVGAKFAPGPSGIPFGWTTRDSNGILGFKYVEQKVAEAATEADLEQPSNLDTYIFAVYRSDVDNLRVITTTLTSAAGLSVTYPVASYETMSYTTNSSGMKEIEESEVLRVSKARIYNSEYDAKPFIAQCFYNSSNFRFRNVNNINLYLQMGGQGILNFGPSNTNWQSYASPTDGYYYNIIRWTSTSYGNSRYLYQSTIISPTAGDGSLNVGSDYISKGDNVPRYYKRVSYYVS